MPIITLPRLLLSLFSWLLLAAAVFLFWRWYDGYLVQRITGEFYRERGPFWMLVAASVIALLCLFGRIPIGFLIAKAGPRSDTKRRDGSQVVAPDGSKLFVETSGVLSAPTVILTHGWGLNATAWGLTRLALEKEYRVVAWDLPGLGRSSGPSDGKYSLDRFAEALAAVVEMSSAERVLLVGHSIGGMTSQTFFRVAARASLDKIAGVALFDTTYLNPMQTMIGAKLWLSLRKVLIEPICWLSIFLWPFAWLSAWQGYLNGTSHLVMRFTGFGGGATRPLVDLTARLSAKGSPAVQSKGNLAMFHWDVSQTLPEIAVPMLIIAGSADIVTLPSASEKIAALSPAARLEIISDVGHMGFMERPETYNRLLLEFASTAFGKHASET